MAKHRMEVTTFVGKLLEETDVDLLREGVRVLAQVLMDAEVTAQIRAEPYERSEARTAHRNGYRTRTWDTRVGTVELRVPKVCFEPFCRCRGQTCVCGFASLVHTISSTFRGRREV
jgi:transposase-like protein